MHNAKSREHAHTCRKARAIFKLRYKKKKNRFSGSLDLTRLPSGQHIFELHLQNNAFSGTVDLSQLPEGLERLNLSDNALSGEVFIPDAFFDIVDTIYTRLIKLHME